MDVLILQSILTPWAYHPKTGIVLSASSQHVIMNGIASPHLCLKVELIRLHASRIIIISHYETHCSIKKCHLRRHCSAELTCQHCRWTCRQRRYRQDCKRGRNVTVTDHSITTAGRDIQTDGRNVITRSGNISAVVAEVENLVRLVGKESR